MKYIQPYVYGTSFTCPFCKAIAKQDWWWRTWDNNKHPLKESNPLRFGTCQHCNDTSIWVNDIMYFPDTSNAPHPNSEMPESVLKIYNEASSIYTKSPRGATALLRLAIQILCVELGESGKNINSDVGNLVKKGLPQIVQQSLDIVRVTGNQAVHPGQIDTDNVENALKLFDLINIIVDYMIAMPNKVNNIYSTLPTKQKDEINQRDS